MYYLDLLAFTELTCHSETLSPIIATVIKDDV